jgi:septal ring factor EnvC (AmiA/AmiB activator)
MRSVEKMTKEQLEAELAKLNPKVEAIRAEYQKLSDQLTVNCNRQRSLSKQLAKIEYDKQSADNKIDWATLLTYSHFEEQYDFLNEAINRRAPLGSVAQSGYFPDAMQYCLQLRLKKNDQAQFDEAYALLEEIIPVMKEVKGWKRIDILEHTLSYHHAMAYKVDDDRWYAGRISRYSDTPYSGGPFDSLKEALRYVAKNHWYSSDDPADREDDNDY